MHACATNKQTMQFLGGRWNVSARNDVHDFSNIFGGWRRRFTLRFRDSALIAWRIVADSAHCSGCWMICGGDDAYYVISHALVWCMGHRNAHQESFCENDVTSIPLLQKILSCRCRFLYLHRSLIINQKFVSERITDSHISVKVRHIFLFEATRRLSVWCDRVVLINAWCDTWHTPLLPSFIRISLTQITYAI